jgi:hypothetical protein
VPVLLEALAAQPPDPGGGVFDSLLATVRQLGPDLTDSDLSIGFRNPESPSERTLLHLLTALHPVDSIDTRYSRLHHSPGCWEGAALAAHAGAPPSHARLSAAALVFRSLLSIPGRARPVVRLPDEIRARLVVLARGDRWLVSVGALQVLGVTGAGGPAEEAVLLARASDPDPTIAHVVALAALRLDPPPKRVLDRLLERPRPEVLYALAFEGRFDLLDACLRDEGVDRARQATIGYLYFDHRRASARAAEAVARELFWEGAFGDSRRPRTLVALLHWLAETSPRVRDFLIRHIDRLEHRQAEFLAAVLHAWLPVDSPSRARRDEFVSSDRESLGYPMAALWLAEGEPAARIAREALADAASGSPATVVAACDALERAGEHAAGAVPDLVALLRHEMVPEEGHRILPLRLPKLGIYDIDLGYRMRRPVVEAIARLGPRAAAGRPALREIVERDEDPRLRYLAGRALARIGP